MGGDGAVVGFGGRSLGPLKRRWELVRLVRRGDAFLGELGRRGMRVRWYTGFEDG